MSKPTNVLHVQVSFAIDLAQPTSRCPIRKSEAGKLLDLIALVIADALPEHLRTPSGDAVAILEGAKIFVGLDEPT